MTVPAVPGPGFLPPAAYSYLDRSAATLERAVLAETCCARYDLAYVAAIRAVAALLAVRVDPRRPRSARQRSAWEALARVAPEFAEWATFFSACTSKRLAAEIGTVAEKMQDAARPAPTGNGGVVDRLLASARSLVRVRAVGNAEGDGVAAQIGRFRNAVTGGDLAKAAEEYATLPEKAKAAGADFMAGLQARLKVDALAQKALASVLKTG